MARGVLDLCLLLGVLPPSTALRLDTEHGAAGDPCECLNFADVYESGQAKCGEGLELLGATFGSPPEEFMDECYDKLLGAPSLASHWAMTHVREGCPWQRVLPVDAEACNDLPDLANSSFFLHQRHNYCVKAAQFAMPTSPFHRTSWCYVSSQCNHLQYGMRINRRVSWKTCTDGQDRFLRDIEVPELCSLMTTLVPTGKSGRACQTAAFYAYDMGPGDWRPDMLEDGRIHAAASRPTYWRDKKNGTAVVMFGERVYEVYGSLRNGSSFKCIGGC